MGMIVLSLYRWDGGGAPPKSMAAPSVTASVSRPLVDAGAFRGHGDLAFVSVGALWVLDGRTGKLTELGGQNQELAAPAFSQNGKWLAYSVGESGAGVARADGASPHTITLTAGSPSWLPNGELLVGTSVYRLSASGRPMRAGTVPAGLVGWATDGSGYAFVSRSITPGADGSFRGVERLELTRSLTGSRKVWRSTPVSFTQANGFRGNVVNGVIVLPRQEGLLFWVDPDQSDVADGMHLYALRSPGATPVNLGVTVGRTVSVGPQGVLAVGVGGNRYAWTAKAIETCTIATAHCTAVHTPPDRVAIDPAWSPTDKKLAFVEAPASTEASFTQPVLAHWYASHHLWLLNTDSHVATEVPDTAGASVPVWSKDGSSLLYESGDGLWLISHPAAKPVKIAAPLFPLDAWPSYYGQIAWNAQFAWSAS